MRLESRSSHSRVCHRQKGRIRYSRSYPMHWCGTPSSAPSQSGVPNFTSAWDIHGSPPLTWRNLDIGEQPRSRFCPGKWALSIGGSYHEIHWLHYIFIHIPEASSSAFEVVAIHYAVDYHYPGLTSTQWPSHPMRSFAINKQSVSATHTRE